MSEEVGGGRRRSEEAGERAAATSATAAPATTHTATFSVLLRLPPTSSALVPIAHPPYPSAGVVRDQQRAVRQHQQPRRPAPPRAARLQLPADDEVGDPYRHSTLHLHPHDLRPRRHRAVPRAVVGDKRV